MPAPVLFFVAAVSAVVAYEYQQRSASAQKKAIDAQNRMAAARNNREKRAQLRKARIQQAQIQAQTQAMGGSAMAPGSGTQGATSSVSSNVAANMSFLDQMTSLSSESAKYRQKAVDANTSASFWNNVSSTAMSYGMK
jgi:hypothetical protein